MIVAYAAPPCCPRCPRILLSGKETSPVLSGYISPKVIAKGRPGAQVMIASEEQGRAEALRRIAACRTARAEELDLGGLQLTALDGELLNALCQLGWLRRLFLGLSDEARERPQLTAVSGSLSRLA
jgi:hypothetical protein